MMTVVVVKVLLLQEVDICHKNALFSGAGMMWPPMFVWTARGPEVSCLHYLNCGIAWAMNVFFHDMQPT